MKLTSKQHDEIATWGGLCQAYFAFTWLGTDFWLFGVLAIGSFAASVWGWINKDQDACFE